MDVYCTWLLIWTMEVYYTLDTLRFTLLLTINWSCDCLWRYIRRGLVCVKHFNLQTLDICGCEMTHMHKNSLLSFFKSIINTIPWKHATISLICFSIYFSDKSLVIICFCWFLFGCIWFLDSEGNCQWTHACRIFARIVSTAIGFYITVRNFMCELNDEVNMNDDIAQCF